MRNVTVFTEEQLEQTALDCFESLGYNIEHGPDVAFDGSRPKHDAKANYTDVSSWRAFERSAGKD